ncbi:MAG: hypothetical protein ABI193_09220 [Minicystis sp.]
MVLFGGDEMGTRQRDADVKRFSAKRAAMSAPHEAIARHLAARFAPALGAQLPALTERVLADEPVDEARFRSGDPSIVLAYAAFIVALSTLAWSAYLQLAQGREVVALRTEMSSLKEALLAELHRTAPHESRLTEPLRGRILSEAAELVVAEALALEPERTRPLLGHQEILELHEAVVSAQLAGSRATLLVGIDAGFVAALPSAERPGEQILRDLGELSGVGALADRSVPLAIWLANAIRLAGLRREAAVFRAARARTHAAGTG